MSFNEGLYDLSVSAEQIKAVAEWCEAGVNMAEVQLVAGGTEAEPTLYATQADSHAAFALDGKAEQ